MKIVHSIRFQLTLLATLVVALIVGGFALTSYLWFRAQLEAELEAFALHEVEEVANVVAGARTASELTALHDALDHLLPEDGVLSLEVWSLGGELIYRKAVAAASLPVDWSEGLVAARERRPVYETIRGPTGPIGVRTALLVSYIREPRWVAIAAVARDRVDASLSAFRRATLLGFAATTLLTLVVSGTVVSRALRPVQQLVRDAEIIKREGPGQRLAQPPPGSELGELAALLNEMLEQIDASLDRLRRFTAHAGHELRTPLTRIRGEVESALASGREEVIREALGGVLEEVESLRAIIDGLLELAQSQETLPRDSASVDLNAILEELVEQARIVGKEREVDVELDAPVRAQVQGSRTLLVRAIWNLIDNALRFAPPRSCVRTRLTLLGPDRIAFEVEDEGPGLGPNPERLFEPFVRGEEQPPCRASGFGLGLALTRAIARRHGGDVCVLAPIGRGACVRLAFPARIEGVPAPRDASD